MPVASPAVRERICRGLAVRVDNFYNTNTNPAPTESACRGFLPGIMSEPEWARLTLKDRDEMRAVCALSQIDLERRMVWTKVSVIAGRTYFPSQFVATALDVADEHDRCVSAGEAGLAYAYPFMLPDRRFVLVPYNDDDRASDLRLGRLTQEDLDLVLASRAAKLTLEHATHGVDGVTQLSLAVTIDVRGGVVYTEPSSFGIVRGGCLDQGACQ